MADNIKLFIFGKKLCHMEHTSASRQGEKSELGVASELITYGHGVSFPFGHNHAYDLIVDKDSSLYRIQVKTAKQEEGNRYYIEADAEKYKKSDVELLAGYSQDKETPFFIPTSEASGKRQRVTFTKLEQMGSDRNRQQSNHISNYRFKTAIKRIDA